MRLSDDEVPDISYLGQQTESAAKEAMLMVTNLLSGRLSEAFMRASARTHLVSVGWRNPVHGTKPGRVVVDVGKRCRGGRVIRSCNVLRLSRKR